MRRNRPSRWTIPSLPPPSVKEKEYIEREWNGTLEAALIVSGTLKLLRQQNRRHDRVDACTPFPFQTGLHLRRNAVTEPMS